jgi:hypothetical protein
VHYGRSGASMQQDSIVGPELLAVTGRAFEAAWEEALLVLGTSPVDPDAIRTLLARRIMEAAVNGEVDPERLKKIALGSVEA